VRDVEKATETIREDGSYGFKPLKLREAREVVVEVAVDDKPFYPSPARKDLAPQAAAWGAKLTARTAMEAGETPLCQPH